MPYNIWVNGVYSASNSGKVIEVRNPATEEVIDTAPAANAADIDMAIKAAQAAFPSWKKLPAGEKAELLHEVAQKLTAHSDKLARLLTLEGGKPLVENKDEMGWEEGLDEFRETKHVHWDFEGEAKPWWYPYAKK